MLAPRSIMTARCWRLTWYSLVLTLSMTPSMAAGASFIFDKMARRFMMSQFL